jgi:hypothetical protein
MSVRKMKSSLPRQKGIDRASSNETVRVEIQAFLQAVDSYPACFAEHPEISFEEFYARLMAIARAAPRAVLRTMPRKTKHSF